MKCNFLSDQLIQEKYRSSKPQFWILMLTFSWYKNFCVRILCFVLYCCVLGYQVAYRDLFDTFEG